MQLGRNGGAEAGPDWRLQSRLCVIRVMDLSWGLIGQGKVGCVPRICRNETTVLPLMP